MFNGNAKYYALLLIATFTWGGSWVAAKILVAIAPPLTIGFFRFLIASILYLSLLKLTGASLRSLWEKGRWKWLVSLAGTGIFGYGVLFLVGMSFTTAAQGAIIAGINPLTISIVAHIVHGERLQRKWQYFGFLLGFLGIFFVVGVQAFMVFNLSYLVGNCLIICAMCVWGVYTSIAKEAMRSMTPLEANAGAAVVGMLLFGISAMIETPWTLDFYLEPLFWWNVFFLGAFTTFIGFLFFFIGIEHLGATKAGGFINFVPVFGTALSFIVLAEEIYWTFLIGMAMVILGVTSINLSGTEERKE